MDCTGRVIAEGHINMLFATVDVAQQCHIIGYGICSQEDNASHAYVASQLRAEVERLVSCHQCGGLGI